MREVHHVALLIGYGAAAVNPYLAMETVEDLVRARRHHRAHPGEGGRQPHQGARQGRAQGHVQDGHLDGRVLPRRPGLRGDRPRPGARRPVLHRHDVAARRRRPRRDRRRGRPPARQGLPGRRRSATRTAGWRPAASTSGAARASRTCSTRRRSSGCSTRPGPGGSTSSASTPGASTSSPARLMTLRGLFRFRGGRAAAGPDRRGRADRRRSSSGSPPGRCPTARSPRRRTRPSRSR